MTTPDLSDDSLAVLTPDTRRAWRQIPPYLPKDLYLAGGTAVALYFRHRQSEDLDFFSEVPLDVDGLSEDLLRSHLPVNISVAFSRQGFLRVMVGSTKVEFSDASNTQRLGPTKDLAGVAVADVSDLLAMKLATITKRRQLRDFEDLRVIEELGGLRWEEGLAYFTERYQIKSLDAVVNVLRALTMVTECQDDPLVETPRQTIEEYVHRRVPFLIAGLSRYSTTELSADLASGALKQLDVLAAKYDMPPLSPTLGSSAPKKNNGHIEPDSPPVGRGSGKGIR